MRALTAVGAVMAMLATGGAQAGEGAEFDARLAQAWAHYRSALHHSGRSGEAQVAKVELAAFLDSWRSMQERWGHRPPPQYSEETEWKETIEAVAGIAARAIVELERKDPDDARSTLDEVGAVLADLRRRNNVVAFSDHMIEFAHALEDAIGAETPSARSAPARRDQMAVLRYLAERIQKNAPHSLQQDPDFSKMADNLQANIQRARTLAEGKAEGLDRALAAIRASFERLQLKFG